MSVLDPVKADAALAGGSPHCSANIKSALGKEYRPPKLARGSCLGLKNMDVLVSWLWEWEDLQFERKRWEYKPYRLLFRQSYSAVEAVSRSRRLVVLCRDRAIRETVTGWGGDSLSRASTMAEKSTTVGGLRGTTQLARECG